MKIAITTNATDNYQYALEAVIQAITQNRFHLETRYPGAYTFDFILVGNESIRKFTESLKSLGWEDESIHEVISDKWREDKKYCENNNLVVAQMRNAAYNRARSLGADYVWTLDADVIPPPNGLACSLDMLRFDDGLYDVAFCPYPSQGGGSFLGGHGSQQKPIFDDYEIDEREVPEDLAKEFELAVSVYEEKMDIESFDAMREIEVKIKKECPPKFNGNVDKLNAEFGRRRRGFLDQAYPGIGEGSVVPIEWYGCGCFLMSKSALGFADFVGFTGRGTEDLYMIWHRFYLKGFRACCITHCPCDHVIRRGEEKEILHCHSYHELRDVEDHGFLKRKYVSFYAHVPGEREVKGKVFQKTHEDQESGQIDTD